MDELTHTNFCAECGKPFVPSRRGVKYCSNRCAVKRAVRKYRQTDKGREVVRRASQRANAKRHPRRPETAVCPVCGKTFAVNPVGNVRKFCSKHCHSVQQAAERKAARRAARPKSGVCPACGKTFPVLPRGQIRKFCSWSCANKAEIAHRAGVQVSDASKTTVCAFCGKAFVPVGNRAKFCSLTCRKSARAARDRVRTCTARTGGGITAEQMAEVERVLYLPPGERWQATKNWTRQMRAYGERVWRERLGLYRWQ